jgi:hypothetical protein
VSSRAQFQGSTLIAFNSPPLPPRPTTPLLFLLQLILLLSLTLVYWIYLRAFAPARTPIELVVEVIFTACDAGTFACGIAVATTPAEDTDKL